MSENISYPSQPQKPFHHRNDSDELDVFEAARYFSGANEDSIGAHTNVSDETRNLSNTTQKYCVRPIRRMSLDMPNHRGNSIPLQAMLMEPMMIQKEKKSKPSSPGGKLAHFLNSLFNQTSKKSKTKTKDEDGGWRRKRRSSISHFSSANSNSSTTTATTATTTTATTITSDSRSPFSTSTTSTGYRTPPHYHIAHKPTKTTNYGDPTSYSHIKPPLTQITKIPINGNHNKIENFNLIKGDLIEKKMNLGNGFVDKVKIFDEKHEDHHPHKYVLKEDIKELKSFINNEDDGAESDSSSDLFELTNCDLGYCSSGLPVYETTHMDTIKRGAPISS